CFLFLNKDVVGAAGLSKTLPQSWDEFTAACEKLKSMGKYCLAVPTQGAQEIERLLTTFMGVNVKGYRVTGPSILKGDYSQVLQPDFVEALKYLRSLFEKEYVVPGSYD